MDLFLNEFFIKAIVASVFVGISCGCLSVWLYLFDIPFFSVAMSHTAFAGAMMGLYFNINPVICAIVLSIIVSFFISPFSSKSGMTINTSTGLVFSLALAIALLLVSKIKLNTSEVFSYIWGNILLVSNSDIFILAIVAVLSIIFLLLFYKGILVVIYNMEIARASLIPVKLIMSCLLLFSSLTIGVNIKMIGALLIYSLVVVPAIAVRQISKNIKLMYFFAIIFSIVACVLGLVLSYVLDFPVGVAISLSAIGMLFVIWCYKKLFNQYCTD